MSSISFMYRALFACCVMFCLFACNQPAAEEDAEAIDQLMPGATQADIDQALITDYATRNNLKTKKLPSGLHYVIEEAGSAEKPNLNSTITAHYRGKLLNGKEFDSSFKKNKPFKFKLGGVVIGWKEGIPLFGKGGKGTILIPSEMAYGSRAMGPIPPNSVLVFDLEIIDFE